MLKRLGHYVDNPRAVYVAVGLYVVAAIAQGLTFGALINFLEPFLAGNMADARRALLWLAGAGVITFILFLVPAVLSITISTKNVCGDTIGRIGQAVTRLPLGFFDAASAGKVSSCISNDANTLSHLLPILVPQLTSAIFTPATVCVVMFVYDWRLGLIMAAVFPVAWVLWRWSLRILMVVQKKEPAISAEAERRTLEFARVQPVLRAQGVTGQSWGPLREALDAEHGAVMRALNTQKPPMLAFTLLSQTFFALVLAVGAGLTIGSEMSAAVFLGAGVMAARFTMPIGQAVIYGAEYQKVSVAFDSIGEIVDAPLLAEPDDPRVGSGYDIEVDTVDFAYRSDRPIFKGLSLQAPANTVTALVGPSGCGKSTVLRLLSRFWDVDSGAVTIGGVDVRDMSTEGLMRQVSMVFQDVYLFDGTIADNVRISRPDATDEDVRNAIRNAGLDSVIARLPDGLDTRVGEGGLKLSGGERQRVSIARAFLKDAPILLLDEVTSALDAENEAVITDTIAKLSRNRTVVVIAHRLSTIMNADRVYVFDRGSDGVGRLCESGTPAELLEHGGAFAQLVDDSKQITRWTIR